MGNLPNRASHPSVRTRRPSLSCVTITVSRPLEESVVSEHISRKELKQDKIKETIEHGAEAVISHGQFTLIVVLVILAAALGYGGWRFYFDRHTAGEPSAFDSRMKAFHGRIAPGPYPPGTHDTFS